MYFYENHVYQNCNGQYSVNRKYCFPPYDPSVRSVVLVRAILAINLSVAIPNIRDALVAVCATMNRRTQDLMFHIRSCVLIANITFCLCFKLIINYQHIFNAINIYPNAVVKESTPCQRLGKGFSFQSPILVYIKKRKMKTFSMFQHVITVWDILY